MSCISHDGMICLCISHDDVKCLYFYDGMTCLCISHDGVTCPVFFMMIVPHSIFTVLFYLPFPFLRKNFYEVDQLGQI